MGIFAPVPDVSSLIGFRRHGCAKRRLHLSWILLEEGSKGLNFRWKKIVPLSFSSCVGSACGGLLEYRSQALVMIGLMVVRL